MSISRRFVDCTGPISPPAATLTGLETQVKLLQAQVSMLVADVTALQEKVTVLTSAPRNAVTKRNASSAAEKQRAYRARLKARKESGQ